MKTWLRRRGDRVRITSGECAGNAGTVEANVHQRTADWPEDFYNGFHVILDSEELVTVQWEQVEAVRLGSN